MLGGFRLKVGSLSAPEPGFFPFVAGAAIAALSLLHFLAKNSHEDINTGSGGWMKAVALACALCAYTLTLEWLGFIIATLLLAIVVMRVSHRQPWLRIIIVSTAASLAAYYLFHVLLRVDLPAGALF